MTEPRGPNKRQYKRNILVNAEGTCRPPPEGVETFLPFLPQPWVPDLVGKTVYLKGLIGSAASHGNS